MRRTLKELATGLLFVGLCAQLIFGMWTCGG